jgi:DNA replication protein DnaC
MATADREPAGDRELLQVQALQAELRQKQLDARARQPGSRQPQHVSFSLPKTPAAAEARARNLARAEAWHAMGGLVAIGQATSELLGRAEARGISTRGPTFAALASFSTTRAWQMLYNRLGTGRLLGILSGDVGTGKTVLLAHAVLWGEGTGKSAPMFIHAGAAFEVLGHPYDPERRALQQRLEVARLLSLDDLGTEAQREQGLPAFRELLARRYQDGLPTLVSTNLPLDDVRAMYFDRRLVDRFEERGTYLQLVGKSRRRKARGA